MNLFARWNRGLGRRGVSAASAHAGDVLLEAAPAPGLDALQARLNHWSRLWSAEGDSASSIEMQQLVSARLAQWMERCFGRHIHRSLHGKGSQISLASSTPIFTAFLGRRATRELSRRVLRDI